MTNKQRNFSTISYKGLYARSSKNESINDSWESLVDTTLLNLMLLLLLFYLIYFKLKNIIKSTANKVRKDLYSIKGFLKNPLVPIKFKELVLKSVVISKVSYIAPLLGSNKINTSSIQQIINLGLY